MAEGAVVAIPPVTPLGKAPGGAGQSTPWTESRRAKFGMDGLGRQSQMGSGTPHTAGELLSAPWQKEPVHCGMECGCTTANTRWFKWDHENDNPIGFLCWPCGRTNSNLFGRTTLKSIKEEVNGSADIHKKYFDSRAPLAEKVKDLGPGGPPHLEEKATKRGKKEVIETTASEGFRLALEEAAEKCFWWEDYKKQFCRKPNGKVMSDTQALRIMNQNQHEIKKVGRLEVVVIPKKNPAMKLKRIHDTEARKQVRTDHDGVEEADEVFETLKADTEMLRQRHKSRAGHVGPSNRTNFGSAQNPAVSTEVVAVEPQVLQLNRSYFG